MSKVYVVNDDSIMVVTVLSTYDKALKFIAKWEELEKKLDIHSSSTFDIEEFEVDFAELPKAYIKIYIHEDGSILHVSKDVVSRIESRSRYIIYHYSTRYNKPLMLIQLIWTTDEEQAIKKTKEKWLS